MTAPKNVPSLLHLRKCEKLFFFAFCTKVQRVHLLGYTKYVRQFIFGQYASKTNSETLPEKWNENNLLESIVLRWCKRKTWPDYFVAHNFIFPVLHRRKNLVILFFCKPCPMTMLFLVSPPTWYTDAALLHVRGYRNRRWPLIRGFRGAPVHTTWNMLYRNGTNFVLTSASG